jgi:DNA replication protein DnaC
MEIKNLARLGIPEDFSGRTWTSFKNLEEHLSEKEKKFYDESILGVQKWMKAVVSKSTTLGLFMYGHNGSGKTTIGCLALIGFLKKGIPAYRITMTKLQQEFYSEWKIPEVVLMKGVLFIDEVGKEYKTKQEHSEAAFEYAIKYRSERRLPTILVSNADINYLSKRYGETVNSIIRGKFLLLTFPEIDLRQRTVDDEIQKILGV